MNGYWIKKHPYEYCLHVPALLLLLLLLSCVNMFLFASKYTETIAISIHCLSLFFPTNFICIFDLQKSLCIIPTYIHSNQTRIYQWFRHIDLNLICCHCYQFDLFTIPVQNTHTHSHNMRWIYSKFLNIKQIKFTNTGIIQLFWNYHRRKIHFLSFSFSLSLYIAIYFRAQNWARNTVRH